MAAAATLSLERLAGEALAAYVVRVLALLNNAAFQMDDGATVVHCSYDVPTFSVESTAAGAAANALAMVALDRNPGEAIGIGTAAGGTVAFCGRIEVALAAVPVEDNATCFAAGVGATQVVPLYDPPTIMVLYTVGAPGAGNASEVQGVDNVADGIDPTAALGAWANAYQCGVITQAGAAIFLGG